MTYSVYPSVAALVEAVKVSSPPEPKGFKGCLGNDYKDEWDRMSRGTSFTGKTSRVISEVFSPHPYEASLVSSMEAEILSDDFFKKKFAFCNRQTVGQRVDIPRYLNGEQRCWFATKRQKRIQKAVRVFAPMGGTCDITKEQMAVCGALSCAVCEMLESNGIAVELWASCCSAGVFARACREFPDEDKWRDICQLVKVKDSNEYVDYGFINFVTGNSHFYRNLVFKDRILAGISAFNSGGRKMFYSVGKSYNMSRNLIPPDEDHDSSLDIVVPRIYEIEDAKRYIQNVLCRNSWEISKIVASGNGEEECE